MERNRIKYPASNLKINTDHENSKNMQRVSYLIAKAPAKRKGDQLNYHDECTIVHIQSP